MLTIKLPVNQIPALWSSIKFASTRVDAVEVEDKQKYLNKLLVDLLSDKAQCFIRIDDDRQLIALAITHIAVDDVTDDKILFVRCLYSFRPVSAEQWRSELPLVTNFAKISGCKKIAFKSGSRRVHELATTHGFNEDHRYFVLEV